MVKLDENKRSPDSRPRTEGEQAAGAVHPLIKAYARICEYIGVNVKNKSIRFEDLGPITIEKISRKLGVRFRQVTLVGEWWKADGGPLLAFLDENKDPVALLPMSPGRYQLYRPSKGTMQPVDRSLAMELQPSAFSLYRPFPSGEIDLRCLMRFGLESFWHRDFWTIVLVGILGGILGTVIPMITGVLFDYVVPGRIYGQIVWLILILLASSFASFTFQLTRSMALLRLEGRTDMCLESALWDRILKLPSQFFRDYSSGDLAARAEGISNIRSVMSGIVINTILAAIFSVFNLVLVFTYNANVGWTVLGCAVITSGVSTLYFKPA